MNPQASLFDVDMELDLRDADPVPAPPAAASPSDATPTAPAFEVSVVRSARRKRTVGARLKGNVLEVIVPTWMSKADTERYVDDMVRRFQKRSRSAEIDLTDRARALARRYELPTPASIRWVGNMEHRWGSCTMSDRTVRISDVLAAYPPWVLDAVIVHELCHLVHGDHSAEFWALANRYPKMERARGYLIAKSGADDEHD